MLKIQHCLVVMLLAAPAASALGSEPVMTPLATGSELAVWRLPATAERRHTTPIVFLHGGPGMYTEARRFDEGAPLRAAGFDTVYFDQAGGGRSARLPAAAYGLERAVADLEALRIALGQEQMVLWGNSYGAALAMIYAARHPARVAGFILTAPGMFPGYSGARDYSRTDRGRVVYEKALSAAVNRIDKDGAAAEAALPQAEAGVLFDRLVAAELIDGVVCKGAAIRPPALPGGGNLYAQRLIARDLKRLKPAEPPLAAVPALVMRGACDYVPMASAQRYADALGTKVTTIENAGHGLLEQRAAVDTALLGFASTALTRVK
ncbi:alpha/beta hydrolase [Sandarakinorhabdus sp.]|uniref:alpha/beta fold hydrolase n=1 Tax=Sandarakinorhabdus sp. TaxID=1916663 RepID=UPI003340A1FE